MKLVWTGVSTAPVALRNQWDTYYAAPEAFILDADRLARFKREAHVLAALNHPSIAGIYGFEASDAIQALALELVEGCNAA